MADLDFMAKHGPGALGTRKIAEAAMVIREGLRMTREELVYARRLVRELEKEEQRWLTKLAELQGE